MTTPSEIFWTAGFLNERFSAPVTPLGWSVTGAVFEEYALRDPLRFMGYPDANRIPATRLVHGHPYTNVLIFQILYNPFPAALLPADAMRYFPQGDVSWRTRAPYPRSMFNPRLLIALLAHFVRDPVSWSPFNYWHWQRYTHQHNRRVAELNTRLDQATTPSEIFDVLADAQQVHTNFAKIHRWSLTYADVFYKLLARFAGESAQSLISDVPNLTQRVNDDLRALAQFAARLELHFDSDQAISESLCNLKFSAAVEKFLCAHGHRSFSLDIAVPTFCDDSAQFLRLLNTDESPRAGLDWRAKRDTVRAHRAFWQKPLFDLTLAFARHYASLREDQRYYWQKSLAVSRRAYLKLAEMLRAREVIDSAQDIFYATHAELTLYFEQKLSAEELTRAVQTRRVEWARYEQEYLQSPARAYPAFLRGDTPLEIGPNARAETWQGRGISPGQARGRVRVILDARDLGNVVSGEVLVAPATDPGWTPVFARLSGLVLERGGVLSHAAIVARENHLPAVAGIQNITREVTDGEWLEVDGARGIVRRIKNGSSRPAA